MNIRLWVEMNAVAYVLFIGLDDMLNKSHTCVTLIEKLRKRGRIGDNDTPESNVYLVAIHFILDNSKP